MALELSPVVGVDIVAVWYEAFLREDLPYALAGRLLWPALLLVPLRGDLIHVVVPADEPDFGRLEKSFRTHPLDFFWYGHGSLLLLT